MKLAALSVVLAAPLASAQSLTPTEALTRLFSATELKAEWFAPEFLQQAPLTVIQAQFNAIRAQYGKFVRLDTLDGRVQAVYERGSLIVTTAPLDEQGRFASFGAVPGPAPADSPAGSEAQTAGTQVLKQLLAVNPVDTTLFSADFLKAVPAEKLTELFTEMRRDLGEFKDAAAQGAGWILTFEKGNVTVTQLALDADGKIAGLLLGGSAATFQNLDEAKAAFAALPGDVSLFVTEVGQTPMIDLNSRKLLGIGSTFKLGILSELQAQINAGKRAWTDKITLTDAMKSLPSGTLQDAPAGNEYSLQDLATRMIRDSDNTATDILLNLVGREGVEARLGQRAIPSTRELFALKNPANTELLRAYRAAGLNVQARREVLKQASTAPLPTVADFDGSRTLARDVEWFVSTAHLCQLMNGVAALSATQENPGLVNKNDYTTVSYKGGSEPGVLNLTTQVTTKAGKTYCVSATWNRPEPLNDNAFYGLYQGVMNLLR